MASYLFADFIVNDMPSPLISIIIATYNRSNVLKLAIESVLWQTFTDWELWVIGDACTDDTEEVVASFADPRINFLNLKSNVGEQSGPNNAGFEHARGRFVAYLNHDDLWLPDHLETAVDGLTRTGADLVFTLMDVVNGDGTNHLRCLVPDGRYQPGFGVPASCWVLRRELIEQVGPWRFYRDCYNVPSQNWLYRAWKAGKDLRLIPALTVVAIQSGGRPQVYARREAHENQLYFNRIAGEPDFKARELTRIVANRQLSLRCHTPSTLLTRAAKNLFIRLCVAVKIDPIAVQHFLLYFRKGGSIDRLRHNRGLKAIGRARRPEAMADSAAD